MALIKAILVEWWVCRHDWSGFRRDWEENRWRHLCKWAAAPLGIFEGSFCLLSQLPPLPQQSGWVLWCVKRAMGNIKDGLAAKS